MDFVALRKAHIDWNINQNPTTISIKRTEKKRIGGGFDEVGSTVGPFVVRVFAKSSKSGKDVSTLAGTKEVNTTWSLLADSNADIKSGSEVKDEFEVDVLGKFLVISVRPQIIQSAIVGYQVDLERLS
ncbi:hypothetical protein ACW2QC_07485 [Virgibacillus sp. FSP13]